MKAKRRSSDEQPTTYRRRKPKDDIYVADEEVKVQKRKLIITAKTDKQKEALRKINENDIIFLIGPAGTGKTYLAVMKAIEELMNQSVKRIILTRPIVESGEALGFLPGDFSEKTAPYMRPLFDHLKGVFTANEFEDHMHEKVIEVMPLAYMRGSTMNDAFICADECFIKSTKILVKQDKIKQMSIFSIFTKIKNGEEISVVSFNEETKALEEKKILNIFENKGKKIINVEIDCGAAWSKVISCTENHPFMVYENGSMRYVEASNLKKYDNVVSFCKGKGNSQIINDKNYDIFMGLLLGDGSLSKNVSSKISYRLKKTHSLAQSDYNDLCMEILNGEPAKGLKSGYTGEPECGFASRSFNISEKFIESLFDGEGKKRVTESIREYFTPRTLAMWFQDDGSSEIRKNDNGSVAFHTEGFSENENSILKKILFEKYSIDCKIEFSKGKYYNLRLNYENSDKLFKLVHEMVEPCMQYKLPEKYRGKFKKELLFEHENLSKMTTQRVVKITDNDAVENVYNIEVEGNNNYFANKILVHNCQNMTNDQLKMLLTRMGENSKIVITADPDQTDLPRENNMIEIATRLSKLDRIDYVTFGEEDSVRHPMIKSILKVFREIKENQNA